VSESRPDVVVFCNHGLDGAAHAAQRGVDPGPACSHCVVVQRFRWMVGQDVWVGVRSDAPEVEIRPGDALAQPLDWGSAPGRGRWSLRCRTCDESVPARTEKLHPVLDDLCQNGLRAISLPPLRGELSRRRPRPPRQYGGGLSYDT
jgi:hypothetical protein